MAVSDKINRCLTAVEAVRRELNSADEDHAAIDAIHGLSAAKKQELAEVEARLLSMREQLRKDDEEHTRWRQATAAEKTRGNAEVDRLHEQILDVEGRLQTRQQELKNATDGMAALRSRLGTG
jgi:chromosome segregation ATPase